VGCYIIYYYSLWPAGPSRNSKLGVQSAANFASEWIPVFVSRTASWVQLAGNVAAILMPHAGGFGGLILHVIFLCVQNNRQKNIRPDRNLINILSVV
jgi:hypothetical protein